MLLVERERPGTKWGSRGYLYDYYHLDMVINHSYDRVSCRISRNAMISVSNKKGWTRVTISSNRHTEEISHEWSSISLQRGPPQQLNNEKRSSELLRVGVVELR